MLSKPNEIRDLKPRVREALEQDKMCRNSDNLLIFKVWQDELEKLFDEDLDLDSLTGAHKTELSNASSIIRARRKLQNDEGVLLPTDETVARQRQLFDAQMHSDPV